MKTAAKMMGVAILSLTANGALAQAPIQPSDDTPLMLNLDCPGQAIRTTVVTTDNDDIPIDRKFDTSIQVEIAGETGRVRLPDKLLPVMNSADDGWLKLSELKVDPARITARFRVNFISLPTLEIDRRSGNIRIEGRGSQFYGRCDRASTTNRF